MGHCQSQLEHLVGMNEQEEKLDLEEKYGAFNWDCNLREEYG